MAIDGESFVSLDNNTIKQVKYIKKGDSVLTLNNNYAIVLCIVKTKINNEIPLSNINGMLITKYHTVIKNNKFYNADDIQEAKLTYIDYIYDFVLSGQHVMIVNNIQITTINHQYGSKYIIDDISKVEGFDQGVITNLKAVERYKNFN